MDDEIESWIYLDGPEPEPVREMLDVLRELPPATPEDVARMERTFFANLSTRLSGTPEAPPPAERRQDAPPPPRVRRLELAEPDPEPPATALGPVPEPPVAAPPSKHAPSALASTSLDLKLPPLEERGKLPFVRPQDLLPTQRATRTQQSPAHRPPGLGETAPLADDAIAMARALAALPFARGPAPAGAAVTLGGLTLEQYASFRAELAVRPETEAYLLDKYHVGARPALDDQWQRHLAQNPQMRARFEETLAMFTLYVRDLGADAKRR